MHHTRLGVFAGFFVEQFQLAPLHDGLACGLEQKARVWVYVELRREQARVLDRFAPLGRQRKRDLRDRGTTRCGERRTAPGLNHACARYQRFYFIEGEHDGRKIEAFAEPVTYACFALDWHAREPEIADVSIDRAFGDFEPLSELRSGGEAPAAEVLNDLEKAVGASHCFPSAYRVESHGITFGVGDLRVATHTGRQFGALLNNTSPRRCDSYERGIERRIRIEVNHDAVG